MLDPLKHPRVRRAVHLLDRVRGALRRKPGRLRAEQNLEAFYQRIWSEAAQELGATSRQLSHGFIQISHGAKSWKCVGNTSPIDDLVTHVFVRTKGLMSRLMSDAGLPVGRFREFSMDTLDDAAQFLSQIGGPCVVKPAGGTGGGIGVACNITTPWQLARAASHAAGFGDSMLIEEQIPGDNYRLLFLNGKLIDAIARLCPSVTGDGHKTIRKLVHEANQTRLNANANVAHVLLNIDMDMERTLASQKLSFSSMPDAGRVIAVKTAINENAQEENITVMDRLCPQIIADASAAVALCGAHLAGVDILCTDPTQPLRQTGGVILEVNNPPGFYWHYHKRDGSFPVARHVLQALMEAS